MTNLKFSPVKKDRLFYDRYQYCLGFYLQEANCLRVLSHKHIDDMIDRRQQWREIAQQRWNKGGRNFGTILGRRWQEITDATIANLHLVADKLLTTCADFKLVVSINQGYIYTNDLNFVYELADLPELLYKSYTQAQIVRDKNTVQLKNPRHRFRTYLSTTRLTAEQRHNLEEFLIAQSAHVRLSPALARWIDLPFNRTQDYFFIDHDTESWCTMLSLVHPGVVRKTMPITAAK